MKKVRLIFATMASVVAIGAAFATANPFVATRDYRVNPATGDPISPLTPTAVGSFCQTDPIDWCKITYTLDANGDPILTTGVKTHGDYTTGI
jgi:hypothetical protein